MNLSSSEQSMAESSQSDKLVDEEDGSLFHQHIRGLFRKFHSSLVALLRSEFGEGPPSPEDVANQTFMRLLERGKVSDIRDLEAFSWIMAMNIVRTEKRALRVRAAFADDKIKTPWGDECDTIDPERALSAREEFEIVAHTLQKMPERRRKIFIACRFDGLTPEKAGKIVGVGRTSAVRHIAIATALIEEALEELNNPEANPEARS